MVVITLHANTNPIRCEFLEPLYGATRARLSSALLFDNELTVRKQDTRLFRRYHTAYGMGWFGWSTYGINDDPPIFIAPGYYTTSRFINAVHSAEKSGSQNHALLEFKPGVNHGTTYQLHGNFDSDLRSYFPTQNGKSYVIFGSTEFRGGWIFPTKRFLYLLWGHHPTPRSNFSMNKLRRANDFYVHCDLVDDRQYVFQTKPDVVATTDTLLATLPRDKGMRLKHYTSASHKCPWRLLKKQPHHRMEISVRDQEGELLDFHGEYSTFIVEVE